MADPWPELNGEIQAPAHPAMDVDVTGGPCDGHIYFAYMTIPFGSDDFDIYFRRSNNNGASRSPARRINDDALGNGRDQVHPWLTVDDGGVLSVVWLDRRQDPANRRWRCYASQSLDGGVTWTPNQQVSTEPSDPADAAPRHVAPSKDRRPGREGRIGVPPPDEWGLGPDARRSTALERIPRVRAGWERSARRSPRGLRTGAVLR